MPFLRVQTRLKCEKSAIWGSHAVCLNGQNQRFFLNWKKILKTLIFSLWGFLKLHFLRILANCAATENSNFNEVRSITNQNRRLSAETKLTGKVSATYRSPAPSITSVWVTQIFAQNKLFATWSTPVPVCHILC